MLNRTFAGVLILVLAAGPVFADYKISQQTVIETMTFESTTYSKGVRQRREQKIDFGGNAEKAAIMANAMPNSIEISQCDLKQDVTLSEAKKSYFIDYYDWSSLPPEVRKRRPNQKIEIKGTVTVSSTVTDSGKSQTMFGFKARWLKSVTAFDQSADSCDGRKNVKIETEGWFIDLALEQQSCKVPRAPVELGGFCRPKLVLKAAQDPGFLLEGTTKIYDNDKLQGTTNIKTTALSRATLDPALFEIPRDWTEVDSVSELMPGFSNIARDNSATTIIGNSNRSSSVKTIAVDFFSGSASKVDQAELRSYISQRVSAAGMSGFPINSQAEISSGKFANVIGVEIKKIKESGGAKIGGLFGKVTGNSDVAKLGDSEAEIVVTIYGADGKTVVASMAATEKVKGKGTDAVKAALDKVLGGLLDKIK